MHKLRDKSARSAGGPRADLSLCSGQAKMGALRSIRSARNLVEAVEPATPEKLNCKPGSQGRAMERPLNPKMCKKQKGIAVRRENHKKCISMKSKELIHARVARFQTEKHMENEGISLWFAENKGDKKRLG